MEAAGFGIDQWGFPEMLAAVEGPEGPEEPESDRGRVWLRDCERVRRVGSIDGWMRDFWKSGKVNVLTPFLT